MKNSRRISVFLALTKPISKCPFMISKIAQMTSSGRRIKK
jgi:hypothetical protein